MGGFRARERDVQKLLTAAVIIGVANMMGGFRARGKRTQSQEQLSKTPDTCSNYMHLSKPMT